MNQSSYHLPVLVDVVRNLMEQLPEGPVVDATYGGGGHAQQFIEMGYPVIAFDRDEGVPEPGPTIELLHESFGNMRPVLDKMGVTAIAGALFDLGVSSHQLDSGERGFSYRHDASLDMRMDTSQELSAHVIVNEWSSKDIAEVLYKYGEERFSRRIAERIVAARPVDTTQQLAEIVKEAIPAATRRTGGHPATRTFQGLRIAVNDELREIEDGLDTALELLSPGGRCVVISYHSLEDRIVKHRFRQASTGCECPPEFPVCQCDETASMKLVSRKPIVPGAAEIERNPRARSAKLRVVEAVAA